MAGHISLAFGALLTGASAVAVDLLAAERPIHTLGLGVLVAAIALLGPPAGTRRVSAGQLALTVLIVAAILVVGRLADR